ncbi:hypothetical protein DXG01_013158 [Tephrocybe rancida]|nr:hypothetical protein DXG01_013158 [Tephrocybe rancida]
MASMNDGTEKDIIFKLADDDDEFEVLCDTLEFDASYRVGLGFSRAPRCLGLYDTTVVVVPNANRGGPNKPYERLCGVLILEYCGNHATSFPTEDTLDALLELVFDLHNEGIYHGDLGDPAQCLNHNGKPYIAGFHPKTTYKHMCNVDTNLIKKGARRPPVAKPCPELWEFLTHVRYCLDDIEWMGRLHSIKYIKSAAHIFELPTGISEEQANNSSIPEKWDKAVEKWKEMLDKPDIYFCGTPPELGNVDYSAYIAQKEARDAARKKAKEDEWNYHASRGEGSTNND